MRRKSVVGFFAAALVGLVATLGASGQGTPGKSPARRTPQSLPELSAIGLPELKARRTRLAEALRQQLNGDERGVLVWRAGASGEEDTFRPDPDFLYLTGYTAPDAALVLTITRNAIEERLLIPPRDPAQEKWTGEKLGAGSEDPETGQPDADRKKAREATGFEKIERIDALSGILESKAILSGAAILWTRVEEGKLDADPTPAQRFVERARRAWPQLRVADPRPEIARLRRVKSEAEIALIQRAIDITLPSLREGIRGAATAARENELQGLIDGGFRRRGATGFAFPSIVGAGKNGTTLHYEENLGPVKDGDLVLMDVGASYLGYCADVTRTVPATGRFTPRQKEIYELVLRAQTEAAAVIRPGVTMAEVNQKAKDLIAAAGYGPYFLHSTSHYLGLEVHDAGERSQPLEAGVVLTVEPGIYLKDEGLGIRIEDDYLVTPDGFRKLSGALPSDIPAIEKMVRGEDGARN